MADYDKINSLFSYTNGKPNVANMSTIINNLCDFYKSVYGSDIDLTKGNADYQYIYGIALIINNIFSTVDNMYKQIMPDTAVGSFLDTLCSFSNVIRKEATKSTCVVYVKGLREGSYTYNTISGYDRGGNEWRYYGPIEVSNTDDPIAIIMTCVVDGDIAPMPGDSPEDHGGSWDNSIGDIQTASPTDYILYQIDYPNVGTYKETDGELRSRRKYELNGKSVNVLEGLKAELMSISGVDDVYIYDGGYVHKSLDETEVKIAQIYLVIKYKDVDNKTIGNIIYNKLTPGVSTAKTIDDPNNTNRTYTIEKRFGKETIKLNYYWKQCKPIHPTIEVKYTINKNYNENNVKDDIIKNVKNVTYNTKLGEVLSIGDIMSAVMRADKPVDGVSTFFVTACTIGNDRQANYVAKDAYYEYTNFKFVLNPVTNEVTLTIE